MRQRRSRGRPAPGAKPLERRGAGRGAAAPLDHLDPRGHAWPLAPGGRGGSRLRRFPSTFGPLVTSARLPLALVLIALLAGCAGDPQPGPAAPDEPPARSTEAAPQGPEEATQPDEADLALLPPIGPPAVVLDDGLLEALPLDARIAVVASASAGLAAVTSQADALAYALRRLPRPRDELADEVEDLADVSSRTVLILDALREEGQGLVAATARALREETAAQARHEAAVALRRASPADPVRPGLPLADARKELAEDVIRLTQERSTLAARGALPPPESPLAPALGGVRLVADVAARTARHLEPIADRDLPIPRAEQLLRAAEAVVAAARAAADEADRVRARRAELGWRRRAAGRLVEEAAGLELERLARRLEWIDRELLDERRRGEEAARDAERQKELDAQLARMQRTIDGAAERRREEDAAIADIKSRTARLGPGDPSLVAYQATLDDHRRRLEEARAARDQASEAIQGLQRRFAGSKDAAAGRRTVLAERLAQARVTWEERRDSRPLEQLIADADLEVAALEGTSRALGAEAEDARRRAAGAQAMAAQGQAEGERRLLLIASAPESQRPILVAIEELRALVENTRRDEERVRLDQARSLDEARARAERELLALGRLRDEARAALADVASARRLDAGAILRARDELAAAWAALDEAIDARRAALRASGVVAAIRGHAGELVLALALAIGLVAARVRLGRGLQRIAARSARDRRAFGRPGDGLLFSLGLLLRAALPWAGLAALVLLAGQAGALPGWVARRAALAALTLGAGSVIGVLAGLLLRDGQVHALVNLPARDRASLHRRATLGLCVMTPLAALLVGAWGLPELFATGVVLQAGLLMAVMVTVASLVQVAHEDVAALLRLRVPPPEEGTAFNPVEWAKGLYNRIVDRLLGLLLLDAVLIAVLWGAGHVVLAGFLLRGTVQTVVTVALAVGLVAATRRASGAILSRAQVQEQNGAVRTRIVVSMITFLLARVIELAIAAASVLSLFSAWGGDAEPLAAAILSERMLRGLATAGTIAVILALGYYANRLAAYTIDTFVEQTLRYATSDVARRRDTFAPLAKSASRYLITIATVIYSATLAGFDLVSIVAGLGVIGLAFAFGAQTLVKDVITGFFVIVDDDLAVGDVVKLGAVNGVIENVGVRTTKIRTFEGVLVSIPNGQILQVENFNRGWNRAIVEVAIPWDAPVDRAMAVLKEVAEEYRRQRPDFIIDAPEVQGILRNEGAAVVLRVCVRTAPLAVWQVERELRLRCVVAFAEVKIAIGPVAGPMKPFSAPPAPTPSVTEPAPAAAPQPAAPPAAPTLILPAGHAPAPTPAGPIILPAGAPSVPPPTAPAPTGVSLVAPRAIAPLAPEELVPGGLLAAAALGQLEALATPLGAPAPAPPPEKPELILPPGAERPKAPDKPATRRIVLSQEARDRLADPNYVHSVTLNAEPDIPAEMQASKEAIQKQRAESEAERQAAVGDKTPDVPADAPPPPPPVDAAQKPGDEPGASPPSGASPSLPPTTPHEPRPPEPRPDAKPDPKPPEPKSDSKPPEPKSPEPKSAKPPEPKPDARPPGA